MITYKELQQLLTPIVEQSLNSQPQNSQSPQPPQIPLALILSHRQLRKIPPLIPFSTHPITHLDLSFNYLKDIKPFTNLGPPASLTTSNPLNPSAIASGSGSNLGQVQGNEKNLVQYLNLSFNFLTGLEKLGTFFKQLRIIDANANRIVGWEMSDKQFPVLEAVYLKNNKIKYFVHCPNKIEILCLDHNQLQKLAFTGGSNLQILSASHNKIQEFQIEQSECLTFLDLQSNNLSDLQSLTAFLSKCPAILSLNLLNNLLSKINHKTYLISVLTTCPVLVQVDQIIINPHVRQAFKVMREEEKMEIKMKETQEKYRMRMEEQLKVKEEIIQKLREKEKQVEREFQGFLKMEKQQLDALEGYAKGNMGKKKLAIIQQNKQFTKLANNYNKQPLQPLSQSSSSSAQPPNQLDNFLQILNPKTPLSNQNPNSNPNALADELTQYLVQGLIISKHKQEYTEFLQNKKHQSKQRKTNQSKIKKYLGIENEGKLKDRESKTKNKIGSQGQVEPLDDEDGNQIQNEENSIDEESNNQSQQDLEPEQKQRRKKNMRNPSLVYRNSNQLLGLPVDVSVIQNQNIKTLNQKKSKQDQFVFNRKCLPYLVKNYGFHTVV